MITVARRTSPLTIAALAGGLWLPACAGDDPPTVAPPSLAASTVATTSTTTTSTSAPPTTTSSTTTSVAPTTTTSTTTTPTTTTAPPLPQPIAPPVDAEADEPVIPLGRIAIPKIGLDREMFDGIRLTTLDRGPGHWPGSAMPGSPGNVVVAGHRVSHNQDFRYIDQLVAGDEVIFTNLDGASHTYVVDHVTIEDPSALWIVEQTPAFTATLFACHPPGSVAQRIVAHLELAA